MITSRASFVKKNLNIGERKQIPKYDNSLDV